MGRLQPVDAAERGRDADRAALVAAQRHRHFAQGDDGGTAGRRAARRITDAVRVVHRAAGAGVAAAGEAEIFAHRLADDRAAGIENARRDGRVDIRHIAFHRRGAVHHRHPGEADIVLERDPLALELAGSSALDLGLDVPGAVPVLLGHRPAAGQPRIADRRQLVRHPVERVIRLERRHQGFVMGGEIGRGKGKAELRRDLAQLLQCRDLDGIERHGPLRPS